jgi:hypothetical protein
MGNWRTGGHGLKQTRGKSLVLAHELRLVPYKEIVNGGSIQDYIQGAYTRKQFCLTAAVSLYFDAS